MYISIMRNLLFWTEEFLWAIALEIKWIAISSEVFHMYTAPHALNHSLLHKRTYTISNMLLFELWPMCFDNFVCLLMYAMFVFHV